MKPTVTPSCRVVNIKKAELVHRGYTDFQHWASVPTHCYIGRNMNFYVKGTLGSKWANPYSLKKHSLEESLYLYEQRIRSNVNGLWDALLELDGLTELGCWCKPSGCHGDVLLKLLKERKDGETKIQREEKAEGGKDEATTKVQQERTTNGKPDDDDDVVVVVVDLTAASDSEDQLPAKRKKLS